MRLFTDRGALFVAIPICALSASVLGGCADEVAGTASHGTTDGSDITSPDETPVSAEEETGPEGGAGLSPAPLADPAPLTVPDVDTFTFDQAAEYEDGTSIQVDEVIQDDTGVLGAGPNQKFATVSVTICLGENADTELSPLGVLQAYGADGHQLLRSGLWASPPTTPGECVSGSETYARSGGDTLTWLVFWDPTYPPLRFQLA